MTSYVIRLNNGNLWHPLGTASPSIFFSQRDAEMTVSGFSGRGALAHPTIHQVIGQFEPGAIYMSGYWVGPAV